MALLIRFVATLISTPAAEKESLAYFGTCTGKKSKGIHVARFDPATGRLKPTGQSIEVGSSVSVVFAPAR